MAEQIKVKCNGAQAHVNEINLDDVLKRDVVVRGTATPALDLPERLVLKCRHCAEGRVVITREMLEQ
jgi:hypothetical protein